MRGDTDPNIDGTAFSGWLSRKVLLETVVPAVLLAVLLGIIWQARSALAPFVLGIIVAYVLHPLMRWVEQGGLGRRIPRTLALGIIYACSTIIFGLSLWLIIPPLLAQIQNFILAAPEYVVRVENWSAVLGDWYSRLDLSPEIRAAINGRLTDVGSSVLSSAQAFAVGLIRTTGQTIGFVFGFLLVPLWTFYVLRDSNEIRTGLRRIVPLPARSTVSDLVRISDRILGGYLRGQLTLMAAVGFSVFVGTFILGLTVSPSLGQFSLLLGVVAGITEAVPIIGPFIGGAFGVAIALTDGVGPALWAVLLYFIIQQLENTLLVPKIMGDALDLNPAILIFALAIGTELAGIPGALLAAPTLALTREWVRYLRIRIAGDQKARTALVRGGRSPLSTHPRNLPLADDE